MKKVLFITSRTEDIRKLCHNSRSIWKVSYLKDVLTAPLSIASCFFDFILFDIALTGLYAPDLLYRITAVPSHPPVFILSKEYSFDFFNLARTAGTCGYFHIPYNIDALSKQIDRFFEARGFIGDCPGSGPGEKHPKDGIHTTILGKSILIEQLRRDIFALRDKSEPVMIYGETGSGKDLVARMVHEHSPVSSGPYTPLNVSCITQSLAESVLFGTTRGSYTGANDSKGLFEASDRGTLFLDEIGELDPGIQPKFLRVLEDKQVSRIGSSKTIKVNFRLVCATNKDLGEAVKAGTFRQDLFHRLDVLRLSVPPLRDHPEDIPLLVSGRLQQYHKVLSAEALEKLQHHDWPGNVRELYNCLSRAACCSNSEVINPDQIQL